MRVTRPLIPMVLAAMMLQSCAALEPSSRAVRETTQGGTAGARSDGATLRHSGSSAVERSGGDRALRPFAKRRAMRQVRALAGRIGVRVRTSNHERRAKRHIGARFEALGYRTHVQRYSVDGDTSWNVVARAPNVVDHPMVIGGHMDTVPRSPGANDNASGVAVVLEIARIIAGKPQARFAKLVAFGSEEYGTDGRHHVGSQAFVNRLSPRERRRFPGMISVDMIADGIPLIVGTAGIGPEVVARTLYRKVRAAGIRVVYRTLCDCSDNGPFERAGLPGAFVWSGTEPNYHRPSDTPRNLRPRHLRRTGRAIRAFAHDIGPRMMRRFRSH